MHFTLPFSLAIAAEPVGQVIALGVVSLGVAALGVGLIKLTSSGCETEVLVLAGLAVPEPADPDEPEPLEELELPEDPDPALDDPELAPEEPEAPLEAEPDAPLLPPVDPSTVSTAVIRWGPGWNTT